MDREALLTLLPHIRCVQGVIGRMQSLERMAKASLSVFDQLSQGVLLLDRNGLVMRMNNEASRVLESRDGVLLQQDKLIFQRIKCHRESFGYNSAALVQGMNAETKTLLIERPSGRKAYIAWAMCAKSEELAFDAAGLHAVLLLHDPEHHRNHRSALQDLYDLTPCEAQTASALGAGIEPAEIAKLRRVSINTVRTQRAQIYSKLGIERQCELIKMVLALPMAR